MQQLARRYLTENELADYARISVKTLQRWRVLRFGLAYLKAGGAVRYDIRRFEEWAASRTVEPRPAG